jgi:transposase InsO family protein
LPCFGNLRDRTLGVINAIYFLIRAFFVFHLSLAAENLALRQQRAILQHSVKSPKLRPRDRVFWALLSRLWSNWRSALAKAMGIEEVLIAPRSPWQNPFCERLVGSIRRECLDPMMVLNEDHLRQMLRCRVRAPHAPPKRDACQFPVRAQHTPYACSPVPRLVEPASRGKVLSIPPVGGLPHRYTRAA